MPKLIELCEFKYLGILYETGAPENKKIRIKAIKGRNGVSCGIEFYCKDENDKDFVLLFYQEGWDGAYMSDMFLILDYQNDNVEYTVFEIDTIDEKPIYVLDPFFYEEIQYETPLEKSLIQQKSNNKK